MPHVVHAIIRASTYIYDCMYNEYRQPCQMVDREACSGFLPTFQSSIYFSSFTALLFQAAES